MFGRDFSCGRNVSSNTFLVEVSVEICLEYIDFSSDSFYWRNCFQRDFGKMSSDTFLVKSPLSNFLAGMSLQKVLVRIFLQRFIGNDFSSIFLG